MTKVWQLTVSFSRAFPYVNIARNKIWTTGWNSTILPPKKNMRTTSDSSVYFIQKGKTYTITNDELTEAN